MMRKRLDEPYRDSRRFERMRAIEPLYAALGGVQGQLCKVKDISRGGLGIECTHLDPDAYQTEDEDGLFISLHVPGTPISIKNIPFQLAHATELASPEAQTPSATRRIGLRFGELNREQATALEKLFSEYCVRSD